MIYTHPDWEIMDIRYLFTLTQIDNLQSVHYPDKGKFQDMVIPRWIILQTLHTLRRVDLGYLSLPWLTILIEKPYFAMFDEWYFAAHVHIFKTHDFFTMDFDCNLTDLKQFSEHGWSLSCSCPKWEVDMVNQIDYI
jgi:hypothetical protein